MQISKVDIDSKYYQEILEIFYNWWGKKKGLTLSDIDKIYRHSQDNFKPVIYGLIIRDELVGVIELNERDGIIDKDYQPYIANVFVKEEYRGLGYSRILINDIVEVVKEMGFKDVYLHSKHENYYEKFGFQYIGLGMSKHGPKRIFVRHIT